MSDLPASWAIARIGEVAASMFDGPFGSALKTADYTTDGFRVARLENIGHLRFRGELTSFVSEEKFVSLSRHVLKADDVLFSSFVDRQTRVCLVPSELDGQMINKADCFCMRPRADAYDPRLLAYRLAAPASYAAFSESVRGVTRPRIGLKDLANYEVEVPPVAEQRRIAAKLDGLTARTACARAALARIPSLAARYKLSMLRKAVRGELTAAWRHEARPEPTADAVKRTPPPQQGRGGRDATTEVVPGQAALSVNDPGTPAPPGWAWTPLLRVARQETGHTPSRGVAAYWGGEVPWLGIRDAGAHHGRTIRDTFQTITEAGLANSSARLLPAGTVCLSRTASVGYVAIMARPMATSQDFATWTCSEALVPEFLMYALMAEGDDIRTFGEGSTHTTIYFPAIRALHICLPSPEEQHEIVQRVRAGLAEIDRLSAEAAVAHRLLDRLDQAVLAKAFRGELVPQDPADEPASELLERIRIERAAAPKPRRGRRAAA